MLNDLQKAVEASAMLGASGLEDLSAMISTRDMHKPASVWMVRESSHYRV